MANVNTTEFIKEIFRIVRVPDIRRVEGGEPNAAKPGDPAMWKGSFPLDAVCIYIYMHLILRYIDIWGQHRSDQGHVGVLEASGHATDGQHQRGHLGWRWLTV